MTPAQLARAANIAWDNGDMTEFDRLSCRTIDRAIAEMADEEILALVSTPSTDAAAQPPGVDNSRGAELHRSSDGESL